MLPGYLFPLSDSARLFETTPEPSWQPPEDIAPRPIPEHLRDRFPVSVRLTVGVSGGHLSFSFQGDESPGEHVTLVEDAVADIYRWVLSPIAGRYMDRVVGLPELRHLRDQIQSALSQTRPHWGHLMHLSIEWPPLMR